MVILKNKNENKKVYVAISGGVDSSVALLLLKQAGIYDVTGVYFRTYKPDGDYSYCAKQMNDARDVCVKLGVPFIVFDLREEYREAVFKYMVNSYNNGITPNPDIICNSKIKFGIFAQRAFDMGADYIATGHYARVTHNNDYFSKFYFFKRLCDVKLLKSKDDDKDQTYFLSQVSKNVLQKTLFPIGKYNKNYVRKIARSAGLITADKKDSQGICFVGREINVKSFLNRYINKESGDVLDTDGRIIGTHNGAKLFTIGERHNFRISPKIQSPNMKRMFVIKKDVNNNTITVGNYNELTDYLNKLKTIRLKNLNIICNRIKFGGKYDVRIRHRGNLYKTVVTDISDDFIEIMFITSKPYAPAVGQFVAFYNKDVCLGSGEIYEINIVEN